MSIFTLTFARAAVERAIKTAAQTAGALLIANGTGLLDTDWTAAASVSGMAAVISLLTSIGSDVATGNGPSLGGGEYAVPARLGDDHDDA
ncbi:MAG: holin [Nocardioides sp.]